MKSRGAKGLANRYRPALFSEIIGHEQVVKSLREKWEQEKRPTAYLFSGETGVGKTTIARILAVAANCPHQDLFGEPCVKCRKRWQRKELDIEELNASDITTLDKIKPAVSGYLYSPTPPSLRRVYILDECQRVSKASQDFLLKPVEDGPASTLWIFCTTDPQALLPTLRGRCAHWSVPVFRAGQTEKLVREVLQSERENGYYQEEIEEKLLLKFISNLVEQRICTPRNILMQLEKFLVEKDPKCVFQIDLEGDVRLGRLVWEGDWLKVRDAVRGLSDGELNALRYSLLAYFAAILRKEGRTAMGRKLAQTLEELAQAGSFDETLTGYKVLALLYKLCERFAPRTPGQR